MSIEKMIHPASIAVVGASREEGKVGNEILSNIIDGGFEGDIYPVNPQADEVLGLKAYPDLRAIGAVPDLAIIVVPASIVPKVMNQCAQIGVKSVIIITAGFKEIGEAGAKLEREIERIARSRQIRVVGPNCLGIMVPRNKLNASFGGELPAPGAIGYLSQSGALLCAILDMARTEQIGFSATFSIGNKVDVDELDILRVLGQDQDTRVIAGYLESINDGNAFVREAERVSQHKPILLMKSGGTGAGARAASSHTGSLAGSDEVYESAFDRAGIIRCPSVRAQFDYAQAFTMQPLPAGNRIAVVTNAGGPGIMAADAIERHGMAFAELDHRTINHLREVLPEAANVLNPVDVLGDALADRYEQAMRIVMDDEGVDGMLVLLTPQAMTQCEDTARAVVRISQQTDGMPIFASFLGGNDVRQANEILRNGSVPAYDSPEFAVSAAHVMAEYARWRSRPKRVVKLFPVNRHRVQRIVDRQLRRGMREIGEMESKEILEAYGFVTPKGSIATTADQAGNIADQLGYPVVLKIWSPDIIHKTDVDGVKLGLKNAEEVRDAFDLMMYRIPMRKPDAQILGVLVQEMVQKHTEVILGMNRDPRFGPLMMFGMGGIFVEVLKDVSFYLAPLTADEARQMLVNTRTYRMLKGVRGQEGVDIDAIAEALQRLSQLVTEFPEIQEMDINPFVVGPPGVTPIAVDARISVETPRKGK